MHLSERIFRPLYYGLCSASSRVGPLRPRRLYDILGRLAYRNPEFQWHRNRWGNELLLSPYYHIDRNILVFGTYDETLHFALEQLLEPGDICMDIGANLGEMSLHMASKVSPGGAVYAFEPAPPAFQRLNQHVQRNRAQDAIRTFAIALGDQTGECEIRFADALQDNQGLGSIVNQGGKPGSAKATVAVMTIDEFVRQHEVGRLDLVKVDIQGAEVSLLEGGPHAFGDLSPDLLIEISPEDLACAGKTSRELCSLIEGYGYRIFELTRSGPGARIRASEVPPRFSATNVYCTKKPSQPG